MFLVVYNENCVLLKKLIKVVYFNLDLSFSFF